jgi:hypothetical protein
MATSAHAGGAQQLASFSFIYFPTPPPGKPPWAGLPCPAWPGSQYGPFPLSFPAINPSDTSQSVLIHQKFISDPNKVIQIL